MNKDIPKPIKIIELTFKPHKSSELERIRKTDYFYVFGWSSVYARRLKQRYPELDIENWRIDEIISTVQCKEVEGVKGYVFPNKKVIIRNVFSLDMYKRMKTLKEKHTLVLHYHDIYNIHYILLMPLLANGIKLLMSHHGGTPPEFSNLKTYLKHKILKWGLPHFDAVTYLTRRTKSFLLQHLPEQRTHFLPVGADFDVFDEFDKTEARRMLNLDLNKTYGIYVGKFYKLKSVDLILQAYYTFQSKYNFEVLFVGGDENEINDEYHNVVKSGCPFFNHTSKERLKLLYAGADFYIHPVFCRNFGGLDTTLIEALAANRPVVSPQLLEFEFDHSELGKAIKTRDELLDDIEWMILNHKKFNQCRKTAAKFLNGKTTIIDNLYAIYQSILENERA